MNGGIPNLEHAPEGRKYYGKFKGYIRDNVDPENRGRVRAFVPQVMGNFDDESHWTGWATANMPWFGGMNSLDFGSPPTRVEQIQNTGIEYIGVWIEFEGGEPDFPIWCGTWLIAPTPTSPNAQQDLTNAAGLTGGDIASNPPAGSNLAAINPPEPQPGTNETRMMVKAGRELMIGSVEGGYILIGPYGVSISGVQVLTNGKLTAASTAGNVVD
jgi:hypothetical protein